MGVIGRDRREPDDLGYGGPDTEPVRVNNLRRNLYARAARACTLPRDTRRVRCADAEQPHDLMAAVQDRWRSLERIERETDAARWRARHPAIATLLAFAIAVGLLPACAQSGYSDVPTAGGAAVRHGHVVIGGSERTYRAYIPASLSSTRAAPLVFALHGASGDGDSFAAVIGFDALAETNQFIAIYPDGYHQTWNAGRCCGDAVTQGAGDVAFIRALIDAFEAQPQLHVDPKAVFVSGFSLGGMMAYRLGCELADRVAAVGVVSGVLVYTPCAPQRPVPLLHVHGTSDHVVPYEGQSPPDGLPSVTRSIERWRELSPGVDVQLLTIEGGGHVWPRDIGGSPSMSGIRASDSLWAFFSAHHR